MKVFVTVGSTKFDALIQAILSDSTLRVLKKRGYHRLVIQCGNSAHEFVNFVDGDRVHKVEQDGVSIEVWRYKPSLKEAFEEADLVISHAGSGTILEVLRLGKPLIVIPNPTLLDNHQEEVATALSELGHLKSCTPSQLPTTIEGFDTTSMVPFPPFDGNRFQRLLDEQMGFV
ncbi:glycosyl transferase [Pluteus cervinus]|uniref:Glycosyl transferase n=1 Tax=Pluteus cervinus TaxID=181527 RepID=A0ACD3B2Q8_9AGAR|nr:glycosyl transferase [Pluteus cervinus]